MTRLHALVARYGFAVVVTVLAVLVRAALSPLWGLKVPLITFYPAIMASAWLGGMGPGLTTTLLSALSAGYFFMEPRFRLELNGAADIIALGMFVGIGVFMSVITEALYRTHGRLAAALAREQVARTTAERVARTIQQLQLLAEPPLREVSVDGLMRESLAYVRTAMVGDTATILLLAEDGLT